MVFVANKEDMKKKIKNKIRDYIRRDTKFIKDNEQEQTINLYQAVVLVDKLKNNLCVGCGCEMLFYNYSNWCLYQFSFDRIDNKKIHCIDNLIVCCFSCNAEGYGTIKMSCFSGCHQGRERTNKLITNNDIIDKNEFKLI